MRTHPNRSKCLTRRWQFRQRSPIGDDQRNDAGGSVAVVGRSLTQRRATEDSPTPGRCRTRKQGAKQSDLDEPVAKSPSSARPHRRELRSCGRKSGVLEILEQLGLLVEQLSEFADGSMVTDRPHRVGHRRASHGVSDEAIPLLCVLRPLDPSKPPLKRQPPRRWRLVAPPR